MRKGILFGLAMVLFGCFMGSDEGGPALLGYSVGGCVGACGKATGFNEYTAWELGKDSLGKEKFFVYGRYTDLNAGKLGTRTRSALQSYPKKVAIIDAGGQCLTFHQTGKDTVTIEGNQVIVEVPIEQCFPYLLDSDIP